MERADTLDVLLQDVARVSDASSSIETQLSLGTTLSDGRFQIVRRIGRGGMGLVYQARDEVRRSNVALKTLVRLDSASVYGLKNEFRALADVTHPNLVRLHELFEDAGRWFFTMELVDGTRFDQWVRPRRDSKEASGRLPSLELGRLRAALPQLCEAIAAIHAAGKLHRDLKPNNVLISPHGRVVVLDFGLAIDPEPGGVGQTLQDNRVCGTPAYMAPEQAAGEQASAASDYYALGVILFEALTGQLPFSGRASDIQIEKQRRDAPSVSEVNEQVPADLARLCDALLARDRTARPGRDALRALMGGAEPVYKNTRRLPQPEALLGRDAELSQLHSAYAATRAGRPVVVFVSGESSIGKSTLCRAFLDELREQRHPVVLAGRCHERESVPFQGVDSLIDALSRFLHTLPQADAAALMPREVSALARLFPVLGRIDVVAQAPRRDVVDPQELRLRAFGALCELFDRIRDRWPLVLHIDDVQWLDRDAITLLDFVLAKHEAASMLLILSHRSEEAELPPVRRLRHTLRDVARFERHNVSLGALPPHAARGLAERLLGADDGVLIAHVVEQGSGSPFFIEELARNAQREGRQDFTLPQALLAHVQGLSEEAQHLLRVLAVAEHALSVDTALAVASASHEHLDVLQAERLVRRSDVGGEHAVECYHDKVRSVAAGLAAEALRALHAALFAALQARPHSDVQNLAFHALKAGNRPAAAHYAAIGAERANEATAFDHAALLYARAIELGDYGEAALRDLRVSLAAALANAGRGKEAARAYLQAALGAAAHDAIELKRRAAEQLLISGSITEGRALLGEVLRAVGLRLPANETTALLALGWERLRHKLRLEVFAPHPYDSALSAQRRRELDVLWTATRGLQAVEVVSAVALTGRYVRVALESGLPDHAAQALGTATWFAATRGGARAKAETEALGAQAVALASACDQPVTSGRVQMSLGVAALIHGDFLRCREHCEEAIETLREHCTGTLFELGIAHTFAQNACSSLGIFVPAARLAGLVDEALRRGNALAATMIMAATVVPRLMQGDIDAVTRQLEKAREHWSTHEVYAWPHVQLLLAESFRAVYLGEPQQAWVRLQADWPALEQGRFLRAPLFGVLLRGLRAGAAISLSRENGHDASALTTLARRETRAIASIRFPTAPAYRLLLSAALEYDRDRQGSAAQLLRAALEGFERAGLRPTAAAARRRLGQLVGGTEGTALIAQAEAELSQLAVVDLDSSTRLLLRGFDAG